MFRETDLLPISALQHLVFCERQCALIHTEGAWAENRLTAEGRILHEKTHEADGEIEIREGVRIARGLRLRSLRLGLIGVADVVEFHQPQPEDPERKSPDRPFPVEYKRGKPKPDQSDLIQVCAQAVCLEEMLGVDVPDGAIFYGRPRRRMPVDFTESLRRETETLAARLHALLDSGRTPSAPYEKKCDNCSLLHLCMPRTTGGRRSAARYIARIVSEASTGPAEADEAVDPGKDDVGCCSLDAAPHPARERSSLYPEKGHAGPPARGGLGGE